MMTSENRRAAVYVRISLDKSGEGASLSRQEAACRALADARGWEVVAVHSDTQSAYSAKRRPGWDDVLAQAEDGSIDVIVAYALDRVTRSLPDLVELLAVADRTGVPLVTAQGDLDLTSDSGRMLATVLTGVARFEVERKSSRQKLANAQRAAAGSFFHGGTLPFGYDKDGNVVEAEAALIREAVSDVLAGVALNEIARRWTEAKVPTRRGGKMWRLSSVRSVLANPRLAGIRMYLGEPVATGGWEPIIDEPTHLELKAMLDDPSRKVGGSPLGKTPSNLLSGIATCSVCAEVVHAGSSRGVKVYSCRRGCVAPVRAEVDDYIRQGIILGLLVTIPGTLMPTDKTSSDEDLVAEHDALKVRRDRLAELHAAGTISESEWLTARAPIVAQLDHVEASLAHDPKPLVEPSRLADLSVESFRKMSVLEQRDVLKQLAADVTIYPKGRGRRNVSIREQVTMDVTPLNRQGSIPVLDRPRAKVPHHRPA